MAAYHYEPNDVYEVMEIDIPRPEIPLLQYDYFHYAPDSFDFQFDFD